jgi:tRNA (guanosine-2'-O-)-methyltransferase
METKVLERYLTSRRLERIEDVLSRRTRRLILALEDVHDPHNVAACIRSAEGMGLQEVHVIPGPKGFAPHPKVVQGAKKWIEINRHATPTECAIELRRRGFRIWAGAMTPDAIPIQDLDFSEPVALVFGNEHDGVSQALLDEADGAFVIPMRGFTQSFNISVAAAISLHFAVEARRRLFGDEGDLAPEDRMNLRSRWIELSIPRAAQLKDELRSRGEL